MKYSKLITGGALLAAIAIAIILLGDRESRSIDPTGVPSERADVAAQPQPATLKPLVRNSVPPVSTAPRQPVTARPDAKVEPANPLQVRPDQVLATVNGHPIQLKDMVPLAAGETGKAMTGEQYQSRLNRAIEMELTFQEVAAHEVEMTPEQKQRLKGITQKHEARLSEYQPQGISWSSVTAAQLEFEHRLMSAAPSPDVARQTQYEQALRDVLARLKSSANIITSVPVL